MREYRRPPPGVIPPPGEALSAHEREYRRVPPVGEARGRVDLPPAGEAPAKVLPQGECYPPYVFVN